MPVRASWKGFLRLNQLSIPVKAFTASQSEPEIPLHLLHRGCHQRIRQQRICPVHGLLPADELISGYEYAPGQHLPLESAELEQLQPADDKSIKVDCFVESDAIDPAYHSGRTYYLVPDEPPGQRPFCVVREGMRLMSRHAVAHMVLSRQQRLVVLRPIRQIIAITVLEYPQRIRPAEEYEVEVMQLAAGRAELELMRQLIEAMTDPELELARYRDPYVEGLRRLIEQKGAAFVGMDGPSPKRHEEEDAALIAALRASLTASDGERDEPATSLEARPHGGEELPRTRRLG
jgi:DNA end-binding protein Ku